MAAAPATAEAMGYSGFDFLVVDMEHVPIEVSDLAHILRAIGCTPADAVVRLAWNDQVLVKRVLDAGAQTIMVPFVQTAEEARQAVSFAKYPPEGVRGVAAVHRGSRFGRATDYLKRANGEVAVIVQLETPEAIERLPEIAAVPGVDALFVGPGDLVGRHGAYRQYRSSRGPGADREGRQGSRMQPESPSVSSGPTPTWFVASSIMATTLPPIASDIAMMTGRASDWLGALRDQPAPTDAPTAAY